MRIYLGLAFALEIPNEPAYQAIAWLCWVPNLVVAEWMLRARQVKRPESGRAAAVS